MTNRQRTGGPFSPAGHRVNRLSSAWWRGTGPSELITQCIVPAPAAVTKMKHAATLSYQSSICTIMLSCKSRHSASECLYDQHSRSVTWRPGRPARPREVGSPGRGCACRPPPALGRLVRGRVPERDLDCPRPRRGRRAHRKHRRRTGSADQPGLFRSPGRHACWIPASQIRESEHGPRRTCPAPAPRGWHHLTGANAGPRHAIDHA